MPEKPSRSPPPSIDPQARPATAPAAGSGGRMLRAHPLGIIAGALLGMLLGGRSAPSAGKKEGDGT